MTYRDPREALEDKRRALAEELEETERRIAAIEPAEPAPGARGAKDEPPLALAGELRWRKLAAVAGAGAVAIGLGGLAEFVPTVPGWTVRHAAAAPPDRVDAALEGRSVTVTASIVADEAVEDPVFLLPRDEVVLERRVSISTWSTGRSPHYASRDADAALGVEARSWHARRARVGAYEVDLAAARIEGLEELSVDPSRVRVSEPPSPGHLGWDAANRVFTAVDVAAKNPDIVRLRFLGLRRSTVVTVVGVQRGGRIVPLAGRPDGADGIRLIPGGREQAVSALTRPPPTPGFLLWGACLLLGSMAAFASSSQILLGAGVLTLFAGVGLVRGLIYGGGAASVVDVLLVGSLLTLASVIASKFFRSALLVLGGALAVAGVVALREAAGEGSMLPWAGALVAAAMLLLARHEVGWERVWYE